MKTELKRASDDSKRLTDKLCRLENDNRQLEAMVSRLGGQDARKLKAQVTAVHTLGTDSEGPEMLIKPGTRNIMLSSPFVSWHSSDLFR